LRKKNSEIRKTNSVKAQQPESMKRTGCRDRNLREKHDSNLQTNRAIQDEAQH
jgi:hypothetical protein